MDERPEDIQARETDDLRIDRATGDVASERPGGVSMSDEDRAASALQSALTPASRLPDSLRSKMLAEGEAIVGAGRGGAPVVRRNAVATWLALAACLTIAVGAIAISMQLVSRQSSELRAERELVAMLRERVESNEVLLANAESAVERLRAELDSTSDLVTEQEIRLAEAASRNAEIATRLARATDDLDLARIKIDTYETPADPATLAQNRTKLLEVPGTVRFAWSPFDLPDAPPAEQRDVTGDVIWNDELEQGYLRFVGLDPNDPNIEQYQVWIIDERGLEQKVSGGVFNASADGEIIVPIEPGIDVGRVQLFAITVEDPGGTWVPDLSRRVVAAVRGS